MSEPIDYNEARQARAMSERRMSIGPYVFTRKVAVAPEVIMRWQAQALDDDQDALALMDQTMLACCMPTATRDGQTVPIDSAEAWRLMRTEGDEFGPLTLGDIGEIVEGCVRQMVERPTGQPSDSPDGSGTPPTGTASTDTSPSPAGTLTPSMLVAPSTPPMPVLPGA